MLNWEKPTRDNTGGYWGEPSDLSFVATLGRVETGEQDTDMDYNDDTNEVTYTTYPLYADCTVYIGKDGLLTFEFYEGSVSGNPEDGERITYYHRQCANPAEAQVIATMYGSYYGPDIARYWADYKFTRQEV